MMHLQRTKEELVLLGLDEYKHTASPSISPPESHNSDSSVEVSDGRRFPLFHRWLHPGILPQPILFPGACSPLYPNLLHPANNNNRLMQNHNPGAEVFSKRIFLDAVLKSQRTPTPEEVQTPASSNSPVQVDPIDLSMKTASERGSSPANSERSERSDATGREDAASEADEESDCDSEREMKRIKLLRPTPLDLTTKV